MVALAKDGVFIFREFDAEFLFTLEERNLGWDYTLEKRYGKPRFYTGDRVLHPEWGITGKVADRTRVAKVGAPPFPPAGEGIEAIRRWRQDHGRDAYRVEWEADIPNPRYHQEGAAPGSRGRRHSIVIDVPALTAAPPR